MLKLQSYKRLGIDFDDTLVGNKNSPRLWEYIEVNPLGQEFYIVTFRSGGWEKQVWNDLRAAGSRLTSDHFKGVFAIPHDIWENFVISGSSKLVASLAEISDDPYVVWKGQTCAENDIEVLVDDSTHNVIHGCRKHNIVHIHPDDL